MNALFENLAERLALGILKVLSVFLKHNV